MTFKIATWNINSIKVRLPHVLEWLATNEPDVLALQETKSQDENFPLDAFTEAGYQCVFSGQKTYNGVAIVSKLAASDVVTDISGFEDPQRRILIATIAGIRICNLYVPNGASVDSDKYVYKLHWLQQVTDFVQQQLQSYPRLVVLGDFNIAPSDLDVHDPKVWQGAVLVSNKEREAFQQLLALELDDCFRVFNPDDSGYSWWDYRGGSYRRNNGLRIDHILASSAMSEILSSSWVDQPLRAWEKPSDHVPVCAEFNLNT